MQIKYTHLLVGWLLSLIYYNSLFAQLTPKLNLPYCGVQNSTPAQIEALQRQMILAMKRRMSARSSSTTITYIPIRPHIVRQSDGTGGLDMASLNNLIATTNRYYLSLGVQFYFAGSTPDYINSDLLSNAFPFSDASSIDSYDVSNALNQYYTPRIELPNIAGYSNYPANEIRSTRSVIATTTYSDYFGNHLIPHELGHTFGLFHTFGATTTDELVTRGTGANCTTNGDLLCDTPADPYNMTGVNLISDGNGCPQYDPNSTARDANGDFYSPSLTNIMSYYFPCTHDFTPGQYDRMQAGLTLRQSHTAYSLDFPATNVTPVSNLNATSNGVSVLLTWQDNATNEMGYFVERSTSPTTNFASISGLAPDATTFRDNQASPQMQYYYRIRPSNTTTNNLSSTISISTPSVPLVTGLATTDITGNSARLSWSSSGEGARYELQWRPTGTSTWTTSGPILESNKTLYSLNCNTNYEWQVRVVGGTTYSVSANFLTLCPTPTNLTSNPVRASATLTWIGNLNQTYTIQYRPQGVANWTTVSGVKGTIFFADVTTYSLTGLNSQTAYEWQLQGVCPGSPTVSSTYTNPQSFTTGSCKIPTYSSANNIGAESVTFYWNSVNDEPTIDFEIQYRPVGTTNWTVLSGLTGTSYRLTGLANNTTYEWQLKSVCAAVETSPYTFLSTFTTGCPTPTGLTSTTTSKAAILRWFPIATAEPGTTYTVQYRSIGNANWANVTSLTSSTCSLAGLVSGTTYEWHVLTMCTANAQSNYSTTKTFTPGCNQLVANNLKSLLVTSSSAQLAWTITNDPDTRYTIMYRSVSAANWTTISSLTASPTGGFYKLTGLVNNTQYEWKISTLCSDTQGTTFVAGPTFTTQCMAPINLNALPQVTSALLSWQQMGLDVTYDLNYRRVGLSDWTTSSNLTTNSLLLTGLTGSVQYEWQVRAHCADGQTTDFSLIQAYFTTYSCSVPSPGFIPATNITTTSATLNWTYSFADPGTPSEIRYRIVGTTNWTTLSNIPGTNFSATITLTGLTPNTTYEWQAKVLCSSTQTSLFNNSTTFQTLPSCGSMYTIRVGSWDDPTIWSCNRIPVTTDVVQINHIIIVPINYIANARQIGINTGQKLRFGTNGRLKLGF